MRNTISILVAKNPDPGQLCKYEGACAPSDFIPNGLDYCPYTGRCPISSEDATSRRAPPASTQPQPPHVTVISHGTLMDEHCKAFSEGNDPNKDRINLVFVGINYDDLNAFKKDVNDNLFNNEPGGIFWSAPKGLFKMEPFLSAKNKFNVWYVDEIGHVSEYKQGWGEHGEEANTEIERLSGYCALSNQYTVSFIDWAFRSHADPQIIRMSTYFMKNVLLHEFGHAFGGLWDEYVESSSNFSSSDSSPNCLSVTTEQGCRQNQKFLAFMGRGCGDPDKIDCSEEDPNYNNEVRCFEGCSLQGKGIFRPTFNSIMRSARTATSYGPVNTDILQRKLNQYSGDFNPSSMPLKGFAILRPKTSTLSKFFQPVKLTPYKDGALLYQILMQYNKGKVSVESLKVKGGYFNLKINEGNYEIRLVSKANEMLYSQKFDFPLATPSEPDPSWFDEKGNQIYIPKPEEAGEKVVDQAFVRLLLPYTKDANKIILYEGKIKILDIPVDHLRTCGDNICSPDEKEQCTVDCGRP